MADDDTSLRTLPASWSGTVGARRRRNRSFDLLDVRKVKRTQPKERRTHSQVGKQVERLLRYWPCRDLHSRIRTHTLRRDSPRRLPVIDPGDVLRRTLVSSQIA